LPYGVVAPGRVSAANALRAQDTDPLRCRSIQVMDAGLSLALVTVSGDLPLWQHDMEMLMRLY